jgi:hypothetical protein
MVQNHITQRTQRYAEFAEKTRTANEEIFRAKPVEVYFPIPASS